MRPDFQTARAEFVRQSAALVTLVAVIDAVAKREDLQSGENALPSIPAEGQNTISAAAIVLLAAHFEEYVRQQVQEYFRAVAFSLPTHDSLAYEKVLKAYWRGGTSRLSRTLPGDSTWAVDARRSLESLLRFPVSGDTASIDYAFVSEHENNMRWDTVQDLCGRVGVKTLADRMFDHAGLRANLGSNKRADMSDLLRRQLNDFYTLRNGIVHSISQPTGVGASIVEHWTALLNEVTGALGDVFESSFQDFEDAVGRA